MISKSSGATGASKLYRSKMIRLGVSFGALMAVSAGAAFAQTAAPAAAPAASDDVVVVRGFRGSLQTAISAKKKEDMIVDVIKSEDIAQFPDLNLAESLQRIPGVAIDRDGGEGRTITVRGLGPDFSRTRLNGMEAQATTGGKDSSGGANRGRGFDFNVFASDLFNSITVRKSLSAEIEEGSLGATVDLQTARPFDYKGFTMAGSYQAGYNDLSKKGGGRGSFLISNRWADGKLGALLSVAVGNNTLQEEGPNTTRWENAYAAGNIGRIGSFSTTGAAGPFTTITPCTSSTFSCNTNETSTANPALTGEALKLSEAEHPRIPRYSKLITDQKRLGVTAAFQMRPNPDTLVSLDMMYADYQANRDEFDLEAISFSRASSGLPKSQIYDYTIDSEKSITKASFNNVDIRSEHRFDELETTFTQVNLQLDQNIGEKLKLKLLVGASDSLQNNPEQTTFTWDAYDVQGYSYDFTDSRHPVFNYGTKAGCTVNQACYWSYSPNVTTNVTSPTAATEGTTATTRGDASLIRIRPQSVENKFDTTKLDLAYAFSDSLTFKAGWSAKHYDFYSTELGRITVVPTTGLPARDESANTLWSTGLNTLLQGNLAQYSVTQSVGGNTFLAPNLDMIRATTGYDCRCTNAYGTFTVDGTNSSSRTNNRDAHETDTSSYLQADFHHDILGVPVRGNIGVRVAQTDEVVSGLLGKGTTNVSTTITRSYTDTLPALNISAEPLTNVFVRFAAAKVMARPTLQSLSPGGSITTSTQVISIGNPLLNPVRAATMDLAFEWYADKDSLYSLSFFTKDITSYIQTQVRSEKFSDTGFDVSVLSGAVGQDGNTVYAVTQPINTPGGKLDGYELNLQRRFTFLPGFMANFGGLLNYTHVTSKIKYVVASTTTSVTYREADLINLSPESWNMTLYYEDGPFSARISQAHRAPYISIVLPGSTADFQGKNATDNTDFQATWKVNKNFTVVVEGLNLTDQYDDRNDQYNTVQGNTGQNMLLDYNHPGRQYYMGLRYKY